MTLAVATGVSVSITLDFSGEQFEWVWVNVIPGCYGFKPGISFSGFVEMTKKNFSGLRGSACRAIRNRFSVAPVKLMLGDLHLWKPG